MLDGRMVAATSKMYGHRSGNNYNGCIIEGKWGCLNYDHIGVVNNGFIVYNRGNLVGGGVKHSNVKE